VHPLPWLAVLVVAFISVQTLSTNIGKSVAFVTALEVHGFREPLGRKRTDFSEWSEDDLIGLYVGTAAAARSFRAKAIINDMAIAQLALANRQVESNPGMVRLLRRQVVAITEEIVANQPINPFAWFRLAQLDLVHHRDPDAALDNLIRSIVTGPATHELVGARLRLMARLADEVDASPDRGLFVEQARLAWLRYRRQLLRFARIDPWAEAFARDALAEEPEGQIWLARKLAN